MESLDPEGGENANAAATLIVDLVEAFGKVQLFVVWHWATWFKFPQRLLMVLCGYFVYEIRFTFSEPLSTVTASLPGAKLSVLLLRIVLQDATTKVFEVYLELRMRVHVDDIKIHARHQSRKPVAEVPHNFLKFRHEVNEVKIDIWSSRDGVEGKSTLEVSNGKV